MLVSASRADAQGDGRRPDIADRYCPGAPGGACGRRDFAAHRSDFAALAAVAYRALLSVVDPEVPFTVEDLLDAGTVAPGCAPLADCLLRLALRFGAAREIGWGWQLARGHDLPEVEEVWRLLLAEAP